MYLFCCVRNAKDNSQKTTGGGHIGTQMWAIYGWDKRRERSHTSHPPHHVSSFWGWRRYLKQTHSHAILEAGASVVLWEGESKAIRNAKTVHKPAQTSTKQLPTNIRSNFFKVHFLVHFFSFLLQTLHFWFLCSFFSSRFPLFLKPAANGKPLLYIAADEKHLPLVLLLLLEKGVFLPSLLFFLLFYLFIYFTRASVATLDVKNKQKCGGK